MTSLNEGMLPDPRIEPATVCLPGRQTCSRPRYRARCGLNIPSQGLLCSTSQDLLILNSSMEWQKWAASRQNQQNGMCTQRRLRSAWASTQPDQSLHCPHEETLDPQLPIERTAKALIRLGGCPGWSESSPGTQSFCWFCHEAAQMVIIFLHTRSLGTQKHRSYKFYQFCVKFSEFVPKKVMFSSLWHWCHHIWLKMTSNCIIECCKKVMLECHTRVVLHPTV